MAFEAPSKNARIYILDCVRFLAVSLALWSHGSARFKIHGPETELPGIIGHLVTATATPSLMILFGMIAHVAYSNAFERDQYATTRRLVGRALDCYVALVIACLYGFLNGGDLQYLWEGMILQVGHFDYAIFRIYALVLLIMPFILYLRRKLGWRAYIWILIAVQMYHFSTLDTPNPDGPLSSIRGLFGLGEVGDIWGPSIFQALQFVIFGMAIASAIRARDLGSRLVALGMLGIASALTLIGATQLGEVYVMNLVKGTYRGVNDHHYFAYGMVAFLPLMGGAWLLTKWARAKWIITTVGSHTLTFFLFGNMALAAVGAAIKVTPENGGGPTYVPVAILTIVLSAVAVIAWLELLKRFPIIVTWRDKTRDQALDFIGFCKPVAPKKLPIGRT